MFEKILFATAQTDEAADVGGAPQIREDLELLAAARDSLRAGLL